MKNRKGKRKMMDRKCEVEKFLRRLKILEIIRKRMKREVLRRVKTRSPMDDV